MGTDLNLQRNGYGDAVTIWLICDGILCTDIFLLNFISFFTEKSLITERIGYSILDIKENSVMENCRIKSSISDHTLWENCAVRIASGRTGRQFDAAADWHTSQRLSLVTLMCIKLTFLSHNQDCAGFPWILYRFFPIPYSVGRATRLRTECPDGSGTCPVFTAVSIAGSFSVVKQYQHLNCWTHFSKMLFWRLTKSCLGFPF